LLKPTSLSIRRVKKEERSREEEEEGSRFRMHFEETSSDSANTSHGFGSRWTAMRLYLVSVVFYKQMAVS